MKISGLINNDPTALLDVAQQAWLADNMARNKAMFSGFTMEGDDGDEPELDDNGDPVLDDDGKPVLKKKADDDDGGDGSDITDPKELQRLLDEKDKRMRAADRRAEAAEKKVRDAEKADQDELTRTKGDLEEKEAELTKKDGEISNLRLQVAFLSANKINWHDPDTAMALAQSGDYLEDVIDEDGIVDKKALKAALEKLSKDKPYLVAESKKKEDDDGGPSGEPAGGRSTNTKDKAAAKQEQRQRFPILNR